MGKRTKTTNETRELKEFNRMSCLSPLRSTKDHKSSTWLELEVSYLDVQDLQYFCFSGGIFIISPLCYRRLTHCQKNSTWKDYSRTYSKKHEHLD